MDRRLLFRMRFKDIDLCFGMYENVITTFDNIINLCYNELFTLEITKLNYLGLNSSKEVSLVSFVINDMREGAIKLSLDYCNGILYSVYCSSNTLDNITNNLVAYDTGNNSEIIRNRLDLLCMACEINEHGEKIYIGEYEDFEEEFRHGKFINDMKYVYRITDKEFVDNNEYQRASNVKFFKSSDDNSELKCSLRCGDENITVSIDEIRLLLGEYNE